MHGEPARSTADAKFALRAVYAPLPFAVPSLGLELTGFAAAQGRASPRVCPDPRVSRGTYALVYLWVGDTSPSYAASPGWRSGTRGCAFPGAESAEGEG